MQPDLFPESLPKLVSVENEEHDTTSDRFHRFHEANPAVYNAIVSMSKQVRSKGLKKWSVRSAFHVLRYVSVNVDAGNDYKINDNFSPFYSRMIQARVPELSEFFVNKKSQADNE